MILKTLFYGLLAFFALAVTLYSCYRVLGISTPDEEVIACSNDNDYRMSGNYYIISDVDSLKGDEVEIKSDSSIVYADRLDSLTWELLGKGKLTQVRHGDSTILRSELDILNGRFFICKNIALNDSLKIKFYRQ